MIILNKSHNTVSSFIFQRYYYCYHISVTPEGYLALTNSAYSPQTCCGPWDQVRIDCGKDLSGSFHPGKASRVQIQHSKAALHSNAIMTAASVQMVDQEELNVENNATVFCVIPNMPNGQDWPHKFWSGMECTQDPKYDSFYLAGCITSMTC